MNNTIAPILKQLRKSSGLSVKQTVSQLQHYGIDIASKTLYGYESGLSMPNADVFVALCKIYQCSGTEAAMENIADNISFSQNKPATEQLPHAEFSPDELALLNDYKELDSFGQEIVQQIIKHEKERIRQMKTK